MSKTRYFVQDLPSKAEKYLKKQDASTRKRIKDAIEKLSWFPTEGVIRLECPEELYRIRVGDFRVTFSYDWGKREVHIRAIFHRGDDYKRL